MRLRIGANLLRLSGSSAATRCLSQAFAPSADASDHPDFARVAAAFCNPVLSAPHALPPRKLPIKMRFEVRRVERACGALFCSDQEDDIPEYRRDVARRAQSEDAAVSPQVLT